MEAFTVHKRYAKVLFELALEEKVLEEVANDLHLIKKVLQENSKLQVLIRNTYIKEEPKKRIMETLFFSHINSLTARFISFLLSKGRISNIQGIISSFFAVYHEYKNIKTATLYTKEGADHEAKDRIKNLLEKHTGHRILLESKKDPKLIGGFRLFFNGCLYDASLLTKLKKLEKYFNTNSYEKSL